MKRKNEMHIMHLLMSIIIFTSLIITSANASSLVDDHFQRGQRVDRFQHDSPQGYRGEIYNVAGNVNMNGGCGAGGEIYNVAGNVNVNGDSMARNNAEHPNEYGVGGKIDSPQRCGCGCEHHCGGEINNGAGTMNVNG